MPSGPEEETLKAPLDPEEKTLEAPSDPDEETQEVPLDPEETQKAPLNPEVEIKDVAGFAVGPTDLEGLALPARWKLAISGNLPPNNVTAHVESTGARRRGRSSTAKFSADEQGKRREECVDDGRGAMVLQRKAEVPEPIARGMLSEQ